MADMRDLAQAWRAAGRPLDLAQLYDTAVWSNPTVRARQLEADRGATKAADDAAAKERVDKAKRASSSISSTSGTVPTREPQRSLREDLDAVIPHW